MPPLSRARRSTVSVRLSGCLPPLITVIKASAAASRAGAPVSEAATGPAGLGSFSAVNGPAPSGDAWTMASAAGSPGPGSDMPQRGSAESAGGFGGSGLSSRSRPPRRPAPARPPARPPQACCRSVAGRGSGPAIPHEPETLQAEQTTGSAVGSPVWCPPIHDPMSARPSRPVPAGASVPRGAPRSVTMPSTRKGSTRPP